MPGIDSAAVDIGIDAADAHIHKIVFMSHKGHTQNNFMIFVKLLNQFPPESVEHIRMIGNNKDFHIYTRNPDSIFLIISFIISESVGIVNNNFRVLFIL